MAQKGKIAADRRSQYEALKASLKEEGWVPTKTPKPQAGAARTLPPRSGAPKPGAMREDMDYSGGKNGRVREVGHVVAGSQPCRHISPNQLTTTTSCRTSPSSSTSSPSSAWLSSPWPPWR